MTQYKILNVKLSTSQLKIKIWNKKWYRNNFETLIECCW